MLPGLLIGNPMLPGLTTQAVTQAAHDMPAGPAS
jgi:hypothetical protein